MHKSTFPMSLAWRLLAAITLALGLLFPSGCTSGTEPTPVMGQAPVLRVKIIANASELTLTASQPPQIVTAASPDPRRLVVPADTPLRITLSDRGWDLAGTTLQYGELTIRPPYDGAVRVNNTAYRGAYRLVPAPGGKFDVVNDVIVDDYLKGLAELPVSWSDETFKAQAVVARTYAIWHKQMTKPGRTFDLYADTRSQVYGGMGAESARSARTVDATKGVVLAYGPEGQEKIFQAYFHACCGGATISGADAFNTPSGALVAQNVGDLCKACAKFSWGPIEVSKEELTRRFRAYAASRALSWLRGSTIVRIEVSARNAPGRPTRFSVTDSTGASWQMGPEEFRWAVNTGSTPATALNSAFVSVVNGNDRISFENGRGFGHGVGMCQWCAEARAKQGQNYIQIISQAYPTCVLRQAY